MGFKARGIKARDVLWALGVAMLMLTVSAGLISVLAPSVSAASPDAVQAETIEDVSKYLMDKDAPFVGM